MEKAERHMPGSIDVTAGEFAGWQCLEREPFDDLVGPFYHRFGPDGAVECAFEVHEKNTNGLGIVHGGALMTFADYCFFIAAKSHTNPHEVVTITMNSEFIGSARPGERIYGTGEVIRAGSSIVFVRGALRNADAEILNYSGVAKILRKR